MLELTCCPGRAFHPLREVKGCWQRSRELTESHCLFEKIKLWLKKKNTTKNNCEKRYWRGDEREAPCVLVVFSVRQGSSLFFFHGRFVEDWPRPMQCNPKEGRMRLSLKLGNVFLWWPFFLLSKLKNSVHVTQKQKKKRWFKRVPQELGSRAQISFSRMPKLSSAEVFWAGWEAGERVLPQPALRSAPGVVQPGHAGSSVGPFAQWIGAALCRIGPHSPCLASNSFPITL